MRGGHSVGHCTAQEEMGDIVVYSTPATEWPELRERDSNCGPTEDEGTEVEHGDTGGDEYDQYDYPEEEEIDRLELLPLLALTVLVFVVGFAIGRCSRR